MAGVKSEFGYMQELKAGMRELPGQVGESGMVTNEGLKIQKSKGERSLRSKV